MTPVLFGLLAALSWGSSALVGTHQVRAIGARRSLAWVALLGLVFVLPLAAFVSPPDAPFRSWLYAALSGVCYVGGWLCWMLAVRSGKVGLVTAVVSTDGAAATAISVLAFRETLQAGVAAALAVIIAGVVIAGARRESGERGGFGGRELLFALGAAASFGFSFVAGGQASDLGVAWTLVTSRTAAVLLVLPVLVAPGALRLGRRLVPFVLATALLDLAGYAAFLRGARDGVAIAAVVTSQYAVVAVIGGLLVYRERLTRLQTMGVLVTLAGVAVLATVQS